MARRTAQPSFKWTILSDRRADRRTISGVFTATSGRASAGGSISGPPRGQPAPGRGPIVASGGAPTWPGCVAANHARGRRTGHGPELPAAVQEDDAAHLHGTSFLRPALTTPHDSAPLTGRGEGTIVLV